MKHETLPENPDCMELFERRRKQVELIGSLAIDLCRVNSEYHDAIAWLIGIDSQIRESGF